MEIPEEQERRVKAEINRLGDLEKRKPTFESVQNPHRPQDFRLLKCRKLDSGYDTRFAEGHQSFVSDPGVSTGLPDNFQARLEICSPDSFSVTPVQVRGFKYPGEQECFRRLNEILSGVVPSHYTQNHDGGKAGVYKIRDYRVVLACLKRSKGVKVEEIPWITLAVVEKLSQSFVSGKWEPCKPEHFPDEKVEELIGNLPRKLLNSLLPFQLDGLRFGLRRGGRCLIADEMGLGKTLQAIAIAGCFMNEGSILVVCPAVLRFSWAEELERWLPFCLPSDIHLVFGHQNNPVYLSRWPKIVVISYTMLQHLRKTMLEREWALLIVDESHHLRCSKTKSEPAEIKTVLDVAENAKRIVLLSGTPSLSRPFDIFHQINMLWPGLLGKDKYEFAKTYCDIGFVKGLQGKVFQDFSKGIRLQELNVLLKQTVMIRRLKQHVLTQLPPKRRQIVTILLKKSDIALAKAAVSEAHQKAYKENVVITEANKNSEEPHAGNACGENKGGDVSSEDLGSPNPVTDNQLCGKLSYQELGIAKLSGFRDWFSLHPLIPESDNIPEEADGNTSSTKMVVFAHHHKVLDGIQEFICEKDICFVRIDGTTLPRDRQLAVQSFRSCSEVKVAIIGIEAGGVGLDFSAAQNVVFVELPQTPSLMLQAEDRAHRRGQKSAVNVYIFCAKDTRDESRWKNLNKKLHRVSSTTDGKYDAVTHIEVDDVYSLKHPEEIVEKECLDERPSRADDVAADKLVERLEDQNECGFDSDVSDYIDLKFITDGHVKDNDSFSYSPLVSSLRFEVSQYTGRIHLYSCILGKDPRPKPLYQNFRPEEIETCNSSPVINEETTLGSLGDKHVGAVSEFVKEWNSLRPIERRKLLGKPLQLPLSLELSYLSESTTHNNEGLIRGGSKRRNTPLSEISFPLPPNAVWKKINLRSGCHKKEKEYTQAWTLNDEPLCKLCQKPCKGTNAKEPEYLEDLFCNLDCYEEYRIRTSGNYLRQELFQIEHGICTNCKLDCHQLVTKIKRLTVEKRRGYIIKVAPNLAARKNLLETLVSDPTEGNAWHADHIIPVYRGGGECRLENMRTLCVACHADVTAAQCAERRDIRSKARKQLKTTLKELKNNKNQKISVSDNEKDNDDSDALINVDEDELLVAVPGSAYSNDQKTNLAS
ncbi:PREDICTED: DNA annealing helicase and endonuclease ZRANB3 isoform X2 [Tarenaya hassleriana]|uniref:DNA annealing helicase and endonuclease ZRANB3 isoform X2 n=1 Tax=Tarenaya hassleriana TaxID=28532 RepID=UPI00053C3940|nr:PREDICTED: DNA annealing helicase and endonuclease ZRANB3 isoform X2 [Tarenaya hassleriana]